MEENKEKEKIYYIPIEDIIPNRFQPRLAFDEKELNEYSINREAIILNLTHNKIKKINCFSGIIINNIEAKNRDKITSEKYLQQRFINNATAVNIRHLMGNNGKIYIKEFNKSKCWQIVKKGLLYSNTLKSGKGGIHNGR